MYNRKFSRFNVTIIVSFLKPSGMKRHALRCTPVQHGSEYVIVNGKISIENGEYNGALSGKLLLLTENK